MVVRDYLAVRDYLETVYRLRHHPRFIIPDPLQLVRTYRDHRDREVAAFICASLAMGRVDGILRASRRLLEVTGMPSKLAVTSDCSLRRRLRGFVFRFFDSQELLSFLSSIGHVLREWGSLEAAFSDGITDYPSGKGLAARDGLIALVSALKTSGAPTRSIIVADPARTSASKRMYLFLRWMVRSDCIDPGGWDIIRPSELLVPVDTHMHRIARELGLTERASADLRTSIQITEALKSFDRLDPVRFDFSLTRLGIHPDGALTDLR